MRRPGTDESNVQVSDVLCDFCHSPWSDERPMVEGHHGACICGKCLTLAFTEIVLDPTGDPPAAYSCRMCLEGADDRAALGRAGEPGWQSPLDEGAFICRRCIKQAAGVLHKDKDIKWSKPLSAEHD